MRGAAPKEREQGDGRAKNLPRQQRFSVQIRKEGGVEITGIFKMHGMGRDGSFMSMGVKREKGRGGATRHSHFWFKFWDFLRAHASPSRCRPRLTAHHKEKRVKRLEKLRPVGPTLCQKSKTEKALRRLRFLPVFRLFSALWQQWANGKFFGTFLSFFQYLPLFGYRYVVCNQRRSKKKELTSLEFN